MVMPLYDDDPLRPAIRPFVTWSLIALNIVVFILEFAAADVDAIAIRAGIIPAAVLGDAVVPDALPAPLTLVTYMFLHADIWHLFSNLIFLWIFGDDIEDAMGRPRFVVFYLACGVISALVFVASDPGARAPLIGASGAVAGVAGAYMLLRPCAKVAIFVFGFIVRISAFWLLGVWVLAQVAQLASQAGDHVAYWAHVGGFICGAVLFVPMRRRGVALFECTGRS
jgi:membrane associated rhomboid family serine protease